MQEKVDTSISILCMFLENSKMLLIQSPKPLRHWRRGQTEPSQNTSFPPSRSDLQQNHTLDLLLEPQEFSAEEVNPHSAGAAAWWLIRTTFISGLGILILSLKPEDFTPQVSMLSWKCGFFFYKFDSKFEESQSLTFVCNVFRTCMTVVGRRAPGRRSRTAGPGHVWSVW